MPLLPDRMRPLWRAALVLGVGLGGFVDGILLHQILQWHHMASARSHDLRFNVLLDGLFHAVTWLLVLAGVWLLFRAWRRWPQAHSGRVLAGGMLAGWGAFNLVEGVVDHHCSACTTSGRVAPAGPGPGTWRSSRSVPPCSWGAPPWPEVPPPHRTDAWPPAQNPFIRTPVAAPWTSATAASDAA